MIFFFFCIWIGNEIEDRVSLDLVRIRQSGLVGYGAAIRSLQVEGDSRGVEVFLTNKGAEIFKKTFAKKGFIGERRFKELVSPFKEEIERRGWDMLCKHIELGKGTLIKEFYANLKDMKNLTCYVRGRWVPFGERTLS